MRYNCSMVILLEKYITQPKKFPYVLYMLSICKIHDIATNKQKVIKKIRQQTEKWSSGHTKNPYSAQIKMVSSSHFYSSCLHAYTEWKYWEMKNAHYIISHVIILTKT